jgi:UDP-N-acetylmuramoyl-L-alanyl-D-glutamate--2,6-diaminopimelate ligase
LKIGLGAFTNFTQDHLDYHGKMEEYFNCKMLLFKEAVCDDGIAVLNADIPEFTKIKEVAAMRGLRIFEYGFCQPSSNHQLINAIEESGLAGDFQKANLLCALTAVIAYYQLDKKQTQFLLNNLDKIQPAQGRMQLVATLKNNAKIFIDFAHTPDALQNILSTTKKLPHNRLIVLFGCGGDRDKSKRPQMGKIASDLADLVIISDDNPRCENPAEIRKEILSGCDLAKTIEVENREIAIKQSITMLKENDILILAGKGHEKYQIIGEQKLPFDEEEIINNYLED